MSTPPNDSSLGYFVVSLVMCSCECAGAVFILVPYVVSFRNQKSTIFANEHDEQSITSLNTRDNVQRTTHFTVEPKANFDRCFFSRSQRCVHGFDIHLYICKQNTKHAEFRLFLHVRFFCVSSLAQYLVFSCCYGKMCKNSEMNPKHTFTTRKRKHNRIFSRLLLTWPGTHLIKCVDAFCCWILCFK